MSAILLPPIQIKRFVKNHLILQYFQRIYWYLWSTSEKFLLKCQKNLRLKQNISKFLKNSSWSCKVLLWPCWSRNYIKSSSWGFKCCKWRLWLQNFCEIKILSRSSKKSRIRNNRSNTFGWNYCLFRDVTKHYFQT